MKRTKKTITLGSGKLYIVEFAGQIPSNEEIEKEEKNRRICGKTRNNGQRKGLPRLSYD